MSAGPLETVRADDFVEYFLFPDLNNTENTVNEDILAAFIENIKDIADKYCENYIWHKDGFRVTPRYGNSSLLIENKLDNCDELPPHAYGISYYEENIQDEWFIVSLLYELTKQIPGLVARIIDVDGEFMLIEAAEHLPKWANPDTCDQRIYIHNGSLHLVQNSPSNTTQILPVSIAVNKIRNNPTLYKVSQDIASCIDARIENFPNKISEGLHRTTVYIPVSAAALLKHNPLLISAAVRAFCNRDQIDMKACRAMKFFPPENRVYTSVVFTKCLYAMLTHNKYIPDRRTGWNLPLASHLKYKAHILGVKLACGFEILASQAKPSADIESNKGWLNYLESVKNRGYFQNYLEFSNDYNRLLDAAKEYYKEHVDSIPYGQEIGCEILADLKNLDYNLEDFKTNETCLPDDDNENWLDISREELDNMLSHRYGIKKIFQSNGNADASELTGKITEFLDTKSEFDGVDFEAINRPILPKRGIKKGKNSIQYSENDGESGTDSPAGNNIDFNPEAFQTHVQEMLDLIIPEDNWESNSDMSDFADENDLERNIDEMGNAKSVKTNISTYMDQMDRELARTTIGKSFENKHNNCVDDNFEDIENFEPVDIDVNTLKNIANSYQSQFGGPGPASTLLGSMGIRVKQEESNDNFTMPNSQV